MIRIEKLNYNYTVYKHKEGKKGLLMNSLKRDRVIIPALKNINLEINEGEIVGLIGLNGAGKTTLLKCISGLLQPKEGSIHVGEYIPSERQKEYLMKLSFFMGQKNQLIWDLPPMETFNIHKAIYKISDNDFKRIIDETSQLLHVEHLLRTPSRQLSLGERVKMEFILSVLHSPKFVLLDEPTIGMDIQSQYSIRSFLKQYLKANNITCIITSHNMEDIVKVAERAVLINKGEIVYDSSISKLIYEADCSEFMYISIKAKEGFVLPEYLQHLTVVSKEDNRYMMKVDKSEGQAVIGNIINDQDIRNNFFIEPEPLEEIIIKLLENKK